MENVWDLESRPVKDGADDDGDDDDVEDDYSQIKNVSPCCGSESHLVLFCN